MQKNPCSVALHLTLGLWPFSLSYSAISEHLMSFNGATEWCDTGHGLSNGLHLEKHTAVFLFSWFLVLFCSVCMLRDLGTLVDNEVNAAVSTATSFVTFMLMHNKYGTDYSLYFIYWTLLRGRLGSLAAHSNRFDWIFDCVLKTIFLYYYMPQKENARSVLT